MHILYTLIYRHACVMRVSVINICSRTTFAQVLQQKIREAKQNKKTMKEAGWVLQL